MIGKTILHYKVLEKLGGGGMGEVYLSEDTKLRRKVALKFLPLEFSRDSEAKKRFITEARSASNLDHNNICVIHEIGETEDGRLFISMNYCEGGTLHEKIKQNQLNIKKSLKYIIQVAMGLQKAHSKGIVHCDIKPSNIIITDDEVAKIVDFGIARLANEDNIISKDRVSGTIVYMSPEQINNSDIDQRTDIWSLGVMLYEMLTGQLPFQDNYNQAIMYSIINEEPTAITSINSEIPIELESIVKKMMEKNPEDRYQHVDDLIAVLRKQMKGKSTKTGKTQPTEQKSVSKSIAILPFTSIDRTEESQVFSDGIHDDILSQVSKIHNLKVVSRSSVSRYKNTEMSIKDIAQELKVDTILEGSVRRTGDKVRINAQLIDAKIDTQLWVETYDRDYVDIFEIQTKVAENIALALETSLTPTEIDSIKSEPTENMEAYNYYLKGKYYYSIKADRDGKMKAAELLANAVELDPNFTLAYALLANVEFDLYHLIYLDPSPKRLEIGKNALQKATSLGPDLPEVHNAKARYYDWIEKNSEKAIIEYLRVLKDRPNDSSIYQSIGRYYMNAGEWEKAESYLLKSYELDPHGLYSASVVATYYMRLRDWEKADYYIDKAIVSLPKVADSYLWKALIAIMGYGNSDKASQVIEEGVQATGKRNMLVARIQIDIWSRNYQKLLDILEQFPDFFDYSLFKGFALWFMGKKEDATKCFESAKVVHEDLAKKDPNNIDNYSYLGLIYAGLGMKKEAIQSAIKAIELQPISKNAYYAPENHKWLAYIYIMVGENDKALDEIEFLLSIPYYFTSWDLKLNPIWDDIRGYPRFQKLIKKYEGRSTSKVLGPLDKIRKAKRLKYYLIPFLLIIGLASVLIYNALNKTTTIPSIGILPMENFGDIADDFWARGITEDLIINIASAGAIRVPSMRDVEKLYVSEQNLTSIAEKLRVDHLLTTSFSKSDSVFDLWCRIIEINSGKDIFAKKWTRPVQSISSITNILAGSVLDNLGISKNKSTKIPELIDPEIYELYLRGKHVWETRQNEDDIQNAQSLLMQALEKDQNYLQAKIQLGQTYTGTADYQQANKIFTECLEHAKDINDESMTALSLLNMGNVQLNQYNIKEALENYEDALLIVRKLNDKYNEGKILRNIGSSYYSEGNFARAEEYYLESRAVIAMLDDQQGEGEVLNNLGSVYKEAKKCTKAMDSYKLSYDIFKRIENKSQMGYSQIGISYCFMGIGEIDSALVYADASLLSAREISDKRNEINSLIHIGEINYFIGNYDVALNLFSEAAELANNINDSYNLGVSNQYLGQLMFRQNKYVEAINYYKRADSIWESLDDPTHRVWTLATWALAELENGDSKTANLKLIQTETILKEYSPYDDYAIHVYFSLYRYYERLEQPSVATKYLTKANEKIVDRLKFVKKSDTKDILTNKIIDYREITELYEKSLP